MALPPLVRARLHTCPAPTGRFLDPCRVRTQLAAERREVPFAERRLGDVVTFALSDRVVVHSVVSIADDRYRIRVCRAR